MKTIELRGRIGRIFGKSFKFDVATVPEFIQALCSQLPGFEEELRKGHYRVVRVSDAGEVITPAEAITLKLGTVHTVRLIPVAAGAKNGLFGIIAGVFLVGAAFLLTGGVLSATAFTLFGSAVTGSQLALFGGLLALSGISGMLAPEVAGPTEPEKEKPSFMISSPQNLINQGHPVPWVAGKSVWCGSVVISNAIAVEDFN